MSDFVSDLMSGKGIEIGVSDQGLISEISRLRQENERFRKVLEEIGAQACHQCGPWYAHICQMAAKALKSTNEKGQSCP